jgi:hypothetical protein
LIGNVLGRVKVILAGVEFKIRAWDVAEFRILAWDVAEFKILAKIQVWV